MYDIKRTVIGAEPISLDEMKAFILNRADDDEDADFLLSETIRAARELAEQFCNRSFVVQENE
jgi:hypothetical protein